MSHNPNKIKSWEEKGKLRNLTHVVKTFMEENSIESDFKKVGEWSNKKRKRYYRDICDWLRECLEEDEYVELLDGLRLPLVREFNEKRKSDYLTVRYRGYTVYSILEQF